MKILAVDDQSDILEMLQIVLDAHGWETTTAAGTKAARALILANTPFNVVVTDYDMPDGNGIELAREIKSLRPTTPVILLTGHGTDKVPDEVSNVEVVIRKPGFDVLIKTLQTIAQAA
jgi:DNA-binding NtrC family response regulator